MLPSTTASFGNGSMGRVDSGDQTVAANDVVVGRRVAKDACRREVETVVAAVETPGAARQAGADDRCFRFGNRLAAVFGEHVSRVDVGSDGLTHAGDVVVVRPVERL